MMAEEKQTDKGPISWMAANSVAANLLMVFLLVGGFFWATKIKQEVFPDFILDKVVVSVVYPGASPEEIEEGIILPVEEAIQGIDGIEEVTSVAREGSGTVTVEAMSDADLQQLGMDIKNEIDRITSFPEEAEEPLVTIPTRKRQVITLVIYGDQTRSVLREVTEMIRDQLLQDKDITQVELLGARELEMTVEVSHQTLRAYNLTIDDIARKIRNSALDLPGGSMKTRGGEILIRMKERKDYQREFARIPIISNADGATVTLGEIARITDGFEDTDQFLVYNGKSAIGIEVFRVGMETPITVVDAIMRHIEQLKQTLPDGVYVDSLNDKAQVFRERVNLLKKNGYLGLILVFGLLGLFLEIRLAFWVTMGIPISFLGSMFIISMFGVSINMVSLFAFIISLGIVVDDTIVIGENIYRYKQQGLDPFRAAIKGVKEVGTPVAFSVVTNIVTFLPLYFVPGMMGKFFRVIPVVVASVFFISLVEALFVLPAHLGHQRESKNFIINFITRYQSRFSTGFSHLVENIYGPFLRVSLRFRYVSITCGLVILMITMAFIKSGRMGITMFPKIESDLSYGSATLAVGVPVEDTIRVNRQMLAAADRVLDKVGREKQLQGILSYIDGNTTWTKVNMLPPDKRVMNTGEFTKLWRQETGDIPGLETMKFEADHGGPGSGAAITVELQHRDIDVLARASAELAEALRFFPIASDIDDGFTPGKDQYDFRLNAEGYQLGLTPLEVARQIRHGYYGYEVLTQFRGRNEMTIMVKNPEQEREAEYYLDEMLISTPGGIKVPLEKVVEISRGKAYTTIDRRDGRRVISVTCDVTPQSQAEMVLDAIKKDTLPELKRKYHGLNYSFEGKQAERKESVKALGRGMLLALLVIYVLLAIPFRSYIQPAIIMVSIPFGIVGAIAGHLIMGYGLSLLSMFGVVALAGVVVNDSLVLIDAANNKIRQGDNHYFAVTRAAIQRFRPIILTTLTTFFGLMPMIFETSRQARFLIPMAISLGFGILFSTLITLVLVPSLYVVVEDMKKLSGRLSWRGDPAERRIPQY